MRSAGYKHPGTANQFSGLAKRRFGDVSPSNNDVFTAPEGENYELPRSAALSKRPIETKPSILSAKDIMLCPNSTLASPFPGVGQESKFIALGWLAGLRILSVIKDAGSRAGRYGLALQRQTPSAHGSSSNRLRHHDIGIDLVLTSEVWQRYAVQQVIVFTASLFRNERHSKI